MLPTFDFSHPVKSERAPLADHLVNGDYALLNPKHSAFYSTPLDLVLRRLRVHRLLITGVAADQCIAMSATEALMRDYEVIVPADCARRGRRSAMPRHEAS